jgi:hypothetical protein
MIGAAAMLHGRSDGRKGGGCVKMVASPYQIDQVANRTSMCRFSARAAGLAR